MNRIFMFAYQNCCGAVGGGGGGEYRLYMANKKYALLDDIYFIYKDRVFHNTDDCGVLAEIKQESASASPLKAVFKSIAPNLCAGMKKILAIQEDEKEFAAQISQLDNQYHFDTEDIYIFHDMQFAHPFLERYPFRKTVMVLHCQGSYYNEWQAFTGRHFKPLHRYYKRMLEDIVPKLQFLGFPARGAEETFIESDPDLAPIVRSAERRYLYTGIECPEFEEGTCKEWIEQLRGKSGYIFSTVAALNAAKSVERIPEYLGALRRAGVDFKWVLVGRGIKADEVKKAVGRAQIGDRTIWIQDFISHEEILELMSVTDFYILFHRNAVFDVSTLEAMHYGAVPILTPVGGNKDAITDGNGIFVSDFKDVSPLLELIEGGRMEELREKNRRIQRERFSDFAFLKRYADMYEELVH